MPQRKSRRGKHEGSIFKNTNGHGWIGQMDLGYVNGKRKKKRVRGATQAIVRKKLGKLLTKRDQGIPLGDDRLTVGQFLDRWIRDHVEPNLRPKTAASYKTNIELHIKPSLGKVPLSKLTAPHIQRFMNEMLKGGSLRVVAPEAVSSEVEEGEAPPAPPAQKGLSPRTVQMFRSLLRKAIGQAVKWDLVSRNVVTLTDPPKVRRYKATPLTSEQGKSLIAAVAGDRLEALFIAAVTLGLRQGELLGLRWCDLDLEAKTVRVSNTMQRVNGEFVFGPTKTEASRRILPLSTLAYDALRAHRRRQREERILMGPEWEDLDLVFATETGKPVDPSNLTRSFKRILAAAELPEIRFHDLRHSCATFLAASGVPAVTAMAQLGHTEIRTTLEIYSHVLPEMLEEAKQAIQKTLGS